MKYYQIDYEFFFHNGRKKIFSIFLNPETLSYIAPNVENPPQWTILKNHQCSCCKMNEHDFLYCPIALSTFDVVENFKNFLSTEKCDVFCKTQERTYMKQTSAMEGIASILGIIMATSGCPVMGFFKPMARFHLPFSTVLETIVRATSMYLLRQYFEYKKGNPPDINLKKLYEYYKKVQSVNEGFLLRINSIVSKDADMNAIIILHSFAQLLSIEILEQLNNIEYLFEFKA
ncbi:MAG: hypothetical protein HQK76_04820 [Desulfobacterales bacterium]|nr:hypothetical protein [Desulfobacterales bacterium]